VPSDLSRRLIQARGAVHRGAALPDAGLGNPAFPRRSSCHCRPLAFGGVHRQIARHENRFGERDYLLDYLLLTPVGGAVSFTL
jgi:hypothetical protein